MRYTLQLETLEGHDPLDDHRAIDLLHRELTFALNASQFVAVSDADIEVEILSRTIPQEGVVRYVVQMYLEERASDLDDEQAWGILRRAFVAADNASFFLRVSKQDLSVELLSRQRVSSVLERRAA